MFTGIITDVGRVRGVEDVAGGRRFEIASAFDVGSIAIGASIAHAGVCLTVTQKGAAGEGLYAVEAWEEALRLTTASDWAEGTRLNLERALRMGDELGGHLVQGHVDGTAKIVGRTDEGEAVRFRLRAPDALARFIAPKGSVALDGTSLTVNGVEGAEFDVLIIRHTLAVTTWGRRGQGDRVNIEIDQMARYAARLAEAAG